ncbi:O-antigen ligase family protein [Sphingomonas baiyangensis]|uniref:O-antigen ligase family protein n=1 Tax=Sphingomonas baiyangensis TaxID=2572576 RepID=UPI001BAEA9C8|nr:O-antigen ligase family protein [Sphingomonas baiyangensis]
MRAGRRPLDIQLILVVLLLGLLWVAGGASRGDVMGQPVVRGGCWAIVAAAILAGPRPALDGARWLPWLLVATIALPLLQLVPLPPAWWQALPGREVLLVPGDAPPWRPLTMTPGATRNALASLIVPATMLLLLAQGGERLRAAMPGLLLAFITAAVLVGLVQFTGARFNHPFVNDTAGQISGIFANRNHFALLIAMGCALAPPWAFADREALRWRGPLAAGLIVLFVLTILATGSRAGMLLGVVGLGAGVALVARRLRRRLSRAPRWVLPALALGIVVLIGGAIAASVLADRADSVNRLLTLDRAEDVRTRALPTVLGMVAHYMPFGSGFGGFDPVFRIHEPLALLKLTYFNQAHNDFLGIALDGGIAGLIVLAAALGWWASATIAVWRAPADEAVLRARLGSAMIALVLAASVFDYPARTPIVMALIVVAAWWLAHGSGGRPRAALPE